MRAKVKYSGSVDTRPPLPAGKRRIARVGAVRARGVTEDETTPLSGPAVRGVRRVLGAHGGTRAEHAERLEQPLAQQRFQRLPPDATQHPGTAHPAS